MSTAGSGRTGHYGAIKMWEAAVNEAGTVERDAVIRALGSARDRAVRLKWFPASIMCEDERVHRTGFGAGIEDLSDSDL